MQKNCLKSTQVRNW